MSCTSCNQTDPCEQVDCTCRVKISTDCSTYTGDDLPCSGIPKGTILTEALQLLDAFICTKFNSVIGYFRLKNTGDGVEIYAGDNNLGEKQIRTLTSLNSIITIGLNVAEDEIDFNVDEEVLTEFIQDEQVTASVDNIATPGAEIFKDTTVIGNNIQYNLRTILVEKQGTGEDPIRDLQENADDITLRYKSYVSDTFTITSTDEEVRFEQPTTASIPALYVNNLYVPSEEEFLLGNTKGFGTLAKPFTDTVTAYVAGVPTITPDTAIQNALDAYLGTGTRLAPELSGQKIIVQDNNNSYTFNGNFNYSNLDIEFQANVTAPASPLVDMDDNTAFDADTSRVTLNILDGYVLQVEGDVFSNSGNTEVGVTYATGRSINLLGKGLIYSNLNDITKYILNADAGNSGNNNDGSLCIYVECNVRADYQGVYKVGGNGRIDFYGQLISGTLTNTVDTSLKAFYQTGGQVRKFKGSQTNFDGTMRDSAIVFDPTGYTPIYISQNSIYSGTATNLFEKLDSNDVDLQVTNSISGYSIVLTELFESPDLWEVLFTENVFASGNIDTTKADLTAGNAQTGVNTIGGNFVEALRTFVSKNSARLSLLPKYAAYLVERDVAAADLQPNVEYKVKVAGTGTPLGTIGDYFIATGTETAVGGVATLIERCTMI